MRPETREDAHDPELVERLGKATGIFMTGGNQLKLSAIVSGTPLGDAILAAHDRGAVVGGTSAGASIQSSHMVAFGGPGATPKQRMTQVAAGLGLLALVGDRPALRPAQPLRSPADDRRPVARSCSASASTRTPPPSSSRPMSTAPPRGAAGGRPGRGDRHRPGPASSPTPTRPSAPSPILASGVVLHVLPAGSAFDLTTRTLVPRGRRGRPRRGRRARRGRQGPAPDGPRHRRRRRLAHALRRRLARNRKKPADPASDPDGATS